MRRRAIAGALAAVAVTLGIVVPLAQHRVGASGPVGAGGSTRKSSGAIVVTGEPAGVYFAETSAGSKNGTNCANAYAYTEFNNGGNWGAGKKIAPGTNVYLCGTIEHELVAEGSGTAGNPVTVTFRPGAKLAKGGAGCNKCFDFPNVSYVTLKGTSESERGVIENTARGVGKSKGEMEAETTAIGGDCQHCVIEDLEFKNLQVMTKAEAEGIGNTQIRAIVLREGAGPNGVVIAHNVFDQMGWAVNIEAQETGSGNDQIEYNTFKHLTHGLAMVGEKSGGSIAPITFAHNQFSENSNWEATSDTNHVDGVHCYSANGKGYTPHYTGFYLYDNYLDAEGGPNSGVNNVTSPIFIEGGSGGTSTPCADSTSKIYIFNNVLWSGTTAGSGNGLLGVFSGESRMYSNTLVGYSTTDERPCQEYNSVSASMVYENNLTSRCKTLIDAEKARFATMDYNLWANAGATNEAFICREPGRKEYTFAQYASWKTCMAQEANGRTATDAKLSLTENFSTFGKPEAGSEALGHGTDLTTACNTLSAAEPIVEAAKSACKQNIKGEARTEWNMGAY